VLEGANPDNIPVLQWKVPYDSATDAAITKATYSVAVSCTGCSFPAATGNLWRNATTSASAVYFDLPIASNLIPALASVPGAATLAVTITMSDGAGNVKTTDPISVPFHLLGPPLAVKDAGFGGIGPDASSYACGNSRDLSYYAMWSAAPLRLRHYVVSNPHQRSVAFSPPTATWTNHEYWKAGRESRAFNYSTIGAGAATYGVPSGATCSPPILGKIPGCGLAAGAVMVGNAASPATDYWVVGLFWPQYSDNWVSCVGSDPGMLGDWGGHDHGGVYWRHGDQSERRWSLRRPARNLGCGCSCRPLPRPPDDLSAASWLPFTDAG
jgi:hypothetical protein